MKRKFLYLFIVGGLLFTTAVKAQTYAPHVSKDSLAILTTRLEILKVNIKIQELKIKESAEEVEIEKLSVKLLEANGNAKQSAAEYSSMSDKFKAGNQDAKAMEKVAKKAKNDSSDAKKYLDRYNRQIQRVEALRIEIKNEERKLSYKKPMVTFDYN